MDFDNTFVDNNGYVRRNKDYVHRLVVENVIGRRLKGEECVHHVNEIKTDYSNKNLVLCQDAAYHKLLHSRQKIVDLGGNPNEDKYCSYHKLLHSRSEFSFASTYDGLFHQCRTGTNEYRKLNGLCKNKWSWRRSMNQQYIRKLKRGGVCEI